jgi:RNA polymerase sigma factor (sigma-70 family)
MGDDAGLSGIFNEIRPRLYRLLVARTGDNHLADDLLQDLWLRLQTAQVGPVANPSAYLHRMAMNLATDHIRSRAQRAVREENWSNAETDISDGIARDGTPDAERALIARDELSRALNAIAEMPPRAAQIFRLHRLEGESHTAIADRLGISRSAVEKSMAVAVKHLFLRLGTEADEDAHRLGIDRRKWREGSQS